MFVVVTSIFGFGALAEATGGAWQVVGNANFSSSTDRTTPIVVDSSGTPYVAYQDGSNSNKATVMKYNGSSWVVVGAAGFSSSTATGLSLALNAAGTPYVAFANAASSSRAIVMKYNGANWITVGNDNFSTSTITDTKIAFNPDDVPYVTFVDSGSHVTVMKLDGSTWVGVGDPYTSVLAAVPILDFSSTGTPYVAFSNISTGQPTIITFNGSSWGLVGEPIASINLAANISFAISPSDVLYVGTIDINDYFLRTFIYNGSSWVQVGSTGTTVTNGDTVMGFAPNGTLYIALEHTTGKAIVMAHNGSDWEVVGESEFSTKAINIMSLAFSPSSVPYVAYSDWDNNTMVVMAFLPTIPGQVTNLSVLAQSPHSIALSWRAPADNGGAAITSYLIERESPVGGGFSTIATVGASPVTYINTGLTHSTVYNYRISAINSAGTGTASASDSVATHYPGSGFVPVNPTPISVGGNGRALAFTMNNDAKTTNNPVVSLGLNADPRTVRGYVVSLDSTFARDTIFPYDASTTTALFTLPNVPGTYTVYFKYYSVSGVYSPLLSQAITYEPSWKANMPSAPISAHAFKRTLKLGSQGDDVKALQVFLNSNGFLIASSGVGSPGHESSLYGNLTAAAVAKFQEAHAEQILAPLGLTKGTGTFGEGTMRVVNLKK